ncbi:MAG: 3-dehydroquinate synthase [Oscillospiraceae bacterium]|jgi:3-dehydroquinate synthase|nr:3-dehydroquinate synthase [Oscillospiraceae bacterium]
MTTIPVPLDEKSYNVHVGGGIFAQLGELCAEAFGQNQPQKILVVSDETVFALYGAQAMECLAKKGYATVSFVIKPGENAKTMPTIERILECAAQETLTGGDAFLALGGGVVGDMTGFAASCYRRGVRFAQVPTTLLAAVDSSVGGKTGVNLAAGKNLAGAFWQPSVVVCDPQLLLTLPAEEYTNGMAETLKYGILWDESLFASLENGALFAVTQAQIARCVALKRDVVCLDEHDTGERRLLNLGHTLGHAVEQVSGYTIPHGAAIAIGMVLIAEFAAEQGWGEDFTQRLKAAFANNRLPVDCPYSIRDLFDAMAQDKKRTGGDITLVVPVRIGVCVLRKMPFGTLKKLLEGGKNA